jgi:hypothetical protein
MAQVTYDEHKSVLYVTLPEITDDADFDDEVSYTNPSPTPYHDGDFIKEVSFTGLGLPKQGIARLVVKGCIGPGNFQGDGGWQQHFINHPTIDLSEVTCRQSLDNIWNGGTLTLLPLHHLAPKHVDLPLAAKEIVNFAHNGDTSIGTHWNTNHLQSTNLAQLAYVTKLYNSFNSVPQLQETGLPPNIVEIEECFGGVGNMRTPWQYNIFHNCNKLLEINECFTQIPLTTVTIPPCVSSIYNSFRQCETLVNFDVNPGQLKEMNQVLYECPALTRVTLNAPMLDWIYQCIKKCRALASLTLNTPAITSVLTSVYDCPALQELTLAVGKECCIAESFNHLGITNITIPNNVGSFSRAASFSHCNKLKTVSFQGGGGGQRSQLNHMVEGCFSHGAISHVHGFEHTAVNVFRNGCFGRNPLVYIALPQTQTQDAWGDPIKIGWARELLPPAGGRRSHLDLAQFTKVPLIKTTWFDHVPTNDDDKPPRGFDHIWAPHMKANVNPPPADTPTANSSLWSLFYLFAHSNTKVHVHEDNKLAIEAEAEAFEQWKYNRVKVHSHVDKLDFTVVNTDTTSNARLNYLRTRTPHAAHKTFAIMGGFHRQAQRNSLLRFLPNEIQRIIMNHAFDAFGYQDPLLNP